MLGRSPACKYGYKYTVYVGDRHIIYIYIIYIDTSHDVLASSRGHVDRFEPQLPDLDAAVNALAKCNRDTWDASRSFASGGNERLPEEDVKRLLAQVERALRRPEAEDPVKQFTTMAWVWGLR